MLVYSKCFVRLVRGKIIGSGADGRVSGFVDRCLGVLGGNEFGLRNGFVFWVFELFFFKGSYSRLYCFKS